MSWRTCVVVEQIQSNQQSQPSPPILIYAAEGNSAFDVALVRDASNESLNTHTIPVDPQYDDGYPVNCGKF